VVCQVPASTPRSCPKPLKNMCTVLVLAPDRQSGPAAPASRQSSRVADAARLGAFAHSDTRAHRPLQYHATVTLMLYRGSMGWERFELALEKQVEAAYLADHPHMQAAEFSPNEQKEVSFQYDLKGMKKVSLACVMHVHPL
jgi:hypothetical protein